MIGSPDILLLPPPSAYGSTGHGGRRAAAIAAVAPAQPLHARRQDEARRDEAMSDSLSDRTGPDHTGARLADPSAGPPANPGQRPARETRWLAAPNPAGHRPATPRALHAGLPFLAQQIAQEVLSSGLYREPWDIGQAAYRRAGGEPLLPADGPALVQLAV